MKFRQIVFFTISLLGTLSISARAEEILAHFKDDFAEANPRRGWKYLINEGVIQDASTYKPLVWNAEKQCYCGDPVLLPSPPPYGSMRIAQSSVHPGVAGHDGSPDRFAIAGYTIMAGGAGKVKLAGSFITRKFGIGTVQLLVLVNKEEVKRIVVAQSQERVSFDTDLGNLKVGDTVYVAIGPDGDPNSDLCFIDFSIVRGE